MMASKCIVSIIICTIGRNEFVKECLNSIFKQIKDDCIEIIIVDNSRGHLIIENLYLQYPQISPPPFKIVNEKIQNLSIARNLGAKEAKGEWLCYIDDDARLHPGYIERAFWVIENNNFDCFGGMYYAWYPFGKPKWMDTNFGTKIPLRKEVGPIEVPELSGGNFLIKKEVLERAGGFPSEFGMSGNNIGYGEEDYLQMKLLEMGYRLGFDPELTIDHAVLPHKLKFSWHLRSWYIHGRDKQRFSGRFSLQMVFWLFIRSFIGALLKTPWCLGKLLISDDYYWQNFVWDVISPVFYRFGQLVAFLK